MLEILARGAWITFYVTILGFLASLPFSAISGFAGLSSNWAVKLVNNSYIAFFRGTSAIVQIYLVFFVLPLVGLTLEPMFAAILVLALNFGAFGSQIVRTTIQNIDKGQWEAAVALNMNRMLTLRRIILPQALIPMIPLFGNELVLMLKATPILSAVAVPELLYQARQLINATGRSVEIYSLLLVLYFAAGYPMTLGVRWLDRKVGRHYGRIAELQQ